MVQDIISADLLHLHRQAFVCVTQSHKIASAVLFVIADAVISELSLPGSTIASIIGWFLFDITFRMILPMSLATFVWMALYPKVWRSVGNKFVHGFDGLERRSEKLCSTCVKTS